MTKMNIMIIEDEQPSSLRLSRFLNEISEIESNIVTVASSNEEAIEWFNANHPAPHLIISDIRLGDGLSFRALQIAPPHVPVIFTTAYDEYAINAFRYNGIAYLMKPIDKEELRQAVLKIQSQISDSQSPISSPSTTDQLYALLSNLSEGGMHYRERFLISFRDELKVIPVSLVSHIGLVEGDIFLYTTTGKQYFLSQTLEELESQLDPKRFARVNRQYIVSVDAVDSMVANFLGKMRLRIQGYPDTNIIVSRAKVPLIKKWLDF